MKIVSLKAYKSNFQKPKKDRMAVTIDMSLEMFSGFREMIETNTVYTLHAKCDLDLDQPFHKYAKHVCRSKKDIQKDIPIMKKKLLDMGFSDAKIKVVPLKLV